MIDHTHRPPEGTKLGKAKAVEAVVLNDGTRLPKKFKVRYWVERTGAREDFIILYHDRAYQLTYLEFKRRFKILIKGGGVQLKIKPTGETITIILDDTDLPPIEDTADKAAS
jgi:hypothetical protein